MARPSWRRRAAVAVEYAIILPAFLMFILGLMDCGRLIWTYSTIARAVEAASRCAAVNAATCGTTTATQAYAVAQAWGLTTTTSMFAVTPAASCGGVSVVGTMPFTFVIPWFYGGSPFGAANAMTLTATACYPT